MKNEVICRLFHDGGPYHIETSPLICRANQWTGFCKIGISIIPELRVTLVIFNTNLTLPTPCISESCIKIDIYLNFYFNTSLRLS